MRTFYDTEHGTIITESELYAEFLELHTTSPEHDYTFQSHIRNCTSKNGTLIEIEE